MWEAWGHGHFTGESVTVPSHPLGEEPFLDIQLKTLLAQSLLPCRGESFSEPLQAAGARGSIPGLLW